MILVDQIEQDVARPGRCGTPLSSRRAAAADRPTAAAAVLAMIPPTRSTFGPMAVAIMGGLTVATLLTLLLCRPSTPPGTAAGGPGAAAGLFCGANCVRMTGFAGLHG